jgi:hypothetical protein
MNRTVCDAIAAKSLIRFDYDGFERVIEPHAHGFNANRKEVVRGFQVRGNSRSGESVGWKFFSVPKMTNIEILPAKLHEGREGQSGAATELIIIHCGTQ